MLCWANAHSNYRSVFYHSQCLMSCLSLAYETKRTHQIYDDSIYRPMMITVVWSVDDLMCGCIISLLFFMYSYVQLGARLCESHTHTHTHEHLVYQINRWSFKFIRFKFIVVVVVCARVGRLTFRIHSLSLPTFLRATQKR